MAANEDFNVAVLDITMGEENGMDLLDTLTRQHPTLPVVMFTSLGNDASLKADALRRGAKGCFSKTDSIDLLFDGLANVIGWS